MITCIFAALAGASLACGNLGAVAAFILMAAVAHHFTENTEQR